MQVTDLLSPERISLNARAGSKKKVLELLSNLLIDKADGEDARLVFESLCSRERLGSTGLGHGVAIPHGRVINANVARAAFLRLNKPIPYDAEDGQPVDMFFALTVPENCNEDHYQLIAQIEDIFSDAELRAELRHIQSAAKLEELLANWKA